jgi:2-oxo-4-hydroxy-4-carboxy-5-ureidoimidazoline decarboxylase
MDAQKRLDALPEDEARAAFRRCCGSERWAAAMTAGRPYHEAPALLAAGERRWNELGREDWLEAFRHHPRIGDGEARYSRFAATRAWAASEQAGAQAADEALLDALAEGNRRYEARFGYIFIVCAAGKSAEQMLALLEARLGNDPDREVRIAAAEQAKITRLRLQKLLTEVSP